MKTWEVIIPPAGGGTLQTLVIEAATWMMALREGLSQLSDPAHLSSLMCNILDHGTLEIVDSKGGRTITIRELSPEAVQARRPDAQAVTEQAMATAPTAPIQAPPAQVALRPRQTQEMVASASGMRGDHVDPYGRSTLCLSYDDGQTWTHPRVINDTPLDDRDTGLISLGGRKLLLTWYSSTMFRNWSDPAPPMLRPENDERFLGPWMRMSDDGGLTWAEPTRTDVYTTHGPIRLRSGEILYLGKRFDMTTMECNGGPESITAIHSTDGGHTWSPLGSVPPAEGTMPDGGYGEPHAVELPDGTLLAIIRYQGPDPVGHELESPGFTMMQTMSTDGGRTWAQAQILNFHGSPPHLLLHSSGAVVCVYGHRREPFGERAMISRDGGRSWTYNYVLRDDGPDWDLGYPSSVEMPDASILTLYYQKAGGVDEKCSLLWTRWKLPD